MRSLTLLEAMVDPDGADYRAGFRAGFVAPRDAKADPGASLAFRVGFQHGRDGIRVPDQMFWRDSAST